MPLASSLILCPLCGLCSKTKAHADALPLGAAGLIPGTDCSLEVGGIDTGGVWPLANSLTLLTAFFGLGPPLGPPFPESGHRPGSPKGPPDATKYTRCGTPGNPPFRTRHGGCSSRYFSIRGVEKA